LVAYQTAQSTKTLAHIGDFGVQKVAVVCAKADHAPRLLSTSENHGALGNSMKYKSIPLIFARSSCRSWRLISTKGGETSPVEYFLRHAYNVGTAIQSCRPNTCALQSELANNDTIAFLSVSGCLFFILCIFAQRSGRDGARARWGWW